MECPKCNATNHEEGAIFCHMCGTQLRESGVMQIGKDEYHHLCQNNARLNDILQQGYAPSGKVLIGKTEYEALIKRHYRDGGNSTRWLIIAATVVIAVLLFLVTRNTLSKDNPSTDELVTETRVESTEFPNNLSGNYIVRKINGENNSNASVKVYQEGSGYAMNVYSSTITKKYTFTYNPSTGEILSDELGSGKARIKEITNETEITFAGWELLK